jgi:ABC-type dipeptide/oligopeptide/nickel transport system permease subunit
MSTTPKEDKEKKKHSFYESGWQLYLGLFIGLISGVVGGLWSQILFEYINPKHILLIDVVCASIAFFALLLVLFIITLLLYRKWWRTR